MKLRPYFDFTLRFFKWDFHILLGPSVNIGIDHYDYHSLDIDVSCGFAKTY